jgi:hypothetical protein
LRCVALTLASRAQGEFASEAELTGPQLKVLLSKLEKEEEGGDPAK